jgi:hypothetical protein
LVVELHKLAGREISIGLDAGPYRIINIDDRAIWEAKVSLSNSQSSELDLAKFSQADKIPTQLRGTLPASFPRPKVRRGGRWRIEMFGGFSRINPSDLNLRATFDDMRNTFYGDDYFRYQVNQGEIVSFAKMNEGGKANLLRHSIPMGIRLRYAIASWFDISFGFNYFTSTTESSFKNTYEVIENGGPTVLYSDELFNYSLSAKGYIPSVGIHLGKRITRDLRLEAYVTGGPLFAECSYFMDWSSGWPVSDPAGDYGSLNEGFLEEKGHGTGLALQAGTRLDFDFAKHYGLFVEGGYAFQTVSELSGPGTRSMTSHRETWEGDWGIKQDIRVMPWGTAHFLWPSNGWGLSQGTWWWARDFELDLSGFQIRLGVYFRF